MNISRTLKSTAVVPALALALMLSNAAPSFAQGQPPAAPQPPVADGEGTPFDSASDLDFDARGDQGGRGGHPGLVMACSTVSSADVVAKALSITAPELRLALTSGKSVSEIAASKNVTIETIQTALQAQRKADLEQAAKDGLITAEQLAALTAAPTNPRNNQLNIRVPARNTVNRYDVAAKAIGSTCAELIKALQQGQSIVEFATAKSKTAQVVIDSVTAAYKAASDADVKEGLITAAQATAQQSRMALEVGRWVYSTGRGQGGQPGQGGRNQGGQPGQGGRGGGQPGQPGGKQPTPAPTVTPAR